MSILKFELTENHLKLVKNLRWSVSDKNIIVGVANDGVDISPPFGEDDLFEAIDLIVNGKPLDFDPFKAQGRKIYSPEEMAELQKLYYELPTAINIILQTQKFDLGNYKTKYGDINWVKND